MGFVYLEKYREAKDLEELPSSKFHYRATLRGSLYEGETLKALAENISPSLNIENVTYAPLPNPRNISIADFCVTQTVVVSDEELLNLAQLVRAHQEETRGDLPF